MQYPSSMKVCTKCSNPKSPTDFPKRSASKDGLASWCKDCFAERARVRYAENQEERDRINRNRKSLREKNQERLLEFLRGWQCADCGNFDVRVLEFDHLGEQPKEYNIGNMMRHYSWARILREIEKCDVVCANCHRIRTAVRAGTWRSLIGM